MEAPVQSEFHRAFAGFATRVRRRRAFRLALTGAGFGLALGASLALGLWAARQGELRPFAAGLGALGAVLGLAFAARRSWSDRDIALFLDARLDSAETLTTALDARNAEQPSLAYVLTRARTILGNADPERVKPRLWSRLHLIVPASLAAIAIISLSPLPHAPTPRALAPGALAVKIENLEGLERIEALAGLPAQNPAQDERLKQLAQQARKLREALAKGLERREALSEIAKLRDGIQAERLKLGDRQNRPGLDAALRAFGNNRALSDARKALSNGDLTAFDEEMQKLANRAENTDRRAAKEALQESAKEARKRGANGLADALEAQRDSFERQRARADALRELARSLDGRLSPELRKDLEDFGTSGDPRAERRLEEGLERALEGLTKEERARLAQRLQEQIEAADGDASPMTKRQIEELAKKLSSQQGLGALEEQLRELAKPEPSPDAERERGLGEAERGGSAAERGLGAMPIPRGGMNGSRDEPGRDPSPSSADPGQAPGTGQRNAGRVGDHDQPRSTPEIAGKELRSKADAHLLAGEALHGATLGRAPARAGETANQLGTGTLGQARSAEIGAVDHADIPEEYREQVGRYFEP